MTQTPPTAREPGLPLVGVSAAVLGALAGWFLHGAWIQRTAAPGAADVAEAPSAAGPTPGGDAAVSGLPDIVLVTVGGLRADRIQINGHPRNTMPWVGQLAQTTGQFFGAAVAASSEALPSAVALHTSRLVSAHGIVGPPITEGPGKARIQTLSPDATTLAEALAEAGYDTRAVVADPTLLGETGLSRGFREYLNVGLSRGQRVQGIAERIGVDRRKSDRPLFLWVHYSDPVGPYNANSPWAWGWAQAMGGGCEASQVGKLGQRTMEELRASPPQDAELECVRMLYDTELRQVDDLVQLLFGDVGIDDDDVFVLAGLHGEEVLDHGAFGHGHTLREELVHVPLMFYSPARWSQPRRVAVRTSLNDVAPTLLEFAGAQAPASMQGASLVAIMSAAQVPERRVPVVTQVGTCRAVYGGSVKAVTDGTSHALFDLAVDPDESRDILAEKPAVASALMAALDNGDVRPESSVVDVAVSLAATLPTAPPSITCR